MKIFFEQSEKQAYRALNDARPFNFPAWLAGTLVPLEIEIVDRIANPSGNTLFAQVDASGYAIKVALGKGYQPPIGGVYFLKSGVALTSGALIVGNRYQIITYVAGDSFTNVGAAGNASGVTFTATGTTPTTWTNATTLNEITEDLDFDATANEVSLALNETSFIESSGGVEVALVEASYFSITWSEFGARTALVGSGRNLSPAGFVDTAVVVTGASAVNAVQMFRISRNPGAFLVLPSVSTDNKGRAGNLDLRSAGMNLILDGASSTPITMEVRYTPTGGVETYLFYGSHVAIAPVMPRVSALTINVLTDDAGNALTDDSGNYITSL